MKQSGFGHFVEICDRTLFSALLSTLLLLWLLLLLPRPRQTQPQEMGMAPACSPFADPEQWLISVSSALL